MAKNNTRIQKHLQYSDRKMIAWMARQGWSNSTMAKTLGVTRQTIWAELRRCQPGEYDAEQAQMQAQQRKQNWQDKRPRADLLARGKRRLHYADRLNLQYGMKAGKTLEQIAGELDCSVYALRNELRRCPKGKYIAEEAQKIFRPGGAMPYESRLVIRKMIDLDPDISLNDLAAVTGLSKGGLRSELIRGDGWPIKAKYDPWVSQLRL